MKKHYQKGFTFVEVLITLSIVIFVFSACFTLYFLAQRFYQRAEERAEILQNGRVILERLSREIRQATEIITPLPQLPDLPGNPPSPSIEFEDGHTPSPYQALLSDYYYIRYYLDDSEVFRQYRVYCFEDCAVCSSFVRWNDFRLEDETQVYPQACNLEEKVIGEYVSDLSFWGANTIQIGLSLIKKGENIDLATQITGRNF